MYYNKFDAERLEDLLDIWEDTEKIRALYSKDINSTILIHGKGACGKSIFAKRFFESIGYKWCLFDPTSSRGFDLYNREVNNNTVDYNVLFNSNRAPQQAKKKKKTAIIIDNFDLICLNNDKKHLFDTITENVIFPKLPIIIISSARDTNKLLIDIEAYTKTKIPRFDFSITNDQVYNICDHISQRWWITRPDGVLESLTKHFHFNLKIILNTMYLLILNHNCDTCDTGTACDSSTLSDELMSYVKTNTFTIDYNNRENILHVLTNLILYPATDIVSVENVYTKDKVLLPLILQENSVSLSTLSRKVSGGCVDIGIIAKVSSLVSFGDYIERVIYNDQNWSLHITHCFISCLLPKLLISASSSASADDIRRMHFNHSTELNKTSLKNINKKNITNLQKMACIDFDEMLLLSQIGNVCIQKKSMGTLLKYIKIFTNHCSVENAVRIVELLMKIDKCNGSHTYVLPYSFKKQIINLVKNQ